jgi:hypothetical protein
MMCSCAAEQQEEQQQNANSKSQHLYFRTSACYHSNQPLPQKLLTPRSPVRPASRPGAAPSPLANGRRLVSSAALHECYAQDRVPFSSRGPALYAKRPAKRKGIGEGDNGKLGLDPQQNHHDASPSGVPAQFKKYLWLATGLPRTTFRLGPCARKGSECAARGQEIAAERASHRPRQTTTRTYSTAATTTTQLVTTP